VCDNLKKLSYLFGGAAILLSDVMCFSFAYHYRGRLCGIEHAGFSAPAETAFLHALPYAAAIIVCSFLAVRFHKKSKPASVPERERR